MLKKLAICLRIEYNNRKTKGEKMFAEVSRSYMDQISQASGNISRSV